ncbi:MULTISPECIES: hypothetical protein [unclassified Pseudomonas]|uniref:hypothetical protein n=1 Tax=unclassified Pseudomonas TaxID=196821 RepID=UPI0023B8AB9A|nr:MULTISPECIES: hypothetical protein [unclassified Pseudomonas]
MVLFSDLQVELETIIGRGEKLDSGNGVRYRARGKGLLTAYSRDIADGNLAELAFEASGLSAATGLNLETLQQQIDQLRQQTGRPVKTNNIHKWPRVGLANSHHVSLVLVALSAWFSDK